MDIKGGYIVYRAGNIEEKLKLNLAGEVIGKRIKAVWDERNPGDVSIFSLILSPYEEVEVKEICLEIPIRLSDRDKVFLNGFQTWTESREFSPEEKLPRLSGLVWPILRQYGDYTIYNSSARGGNLRSFTYTYINKNYEEYTLFGSLDESSGYTIFEYDKPSRLLRIRKDCEGLRLKESFKALELCTITGAQENVFEKYFNSMGVEEPRVKPSTGWTSWYNYYTGITQEIILENLEAFSSRKIPIDIFQIDDGYQNAVGDWLNINDKFPKGMKYIADKIKSRGYKAGLWLAPFVCEKKSNLFRDNPDWILRDEKGKPATAGFNPGWSGMFHALDFYNEGFRSYLRKVFDTVFNEWGYDMVKLDFLYGAALIPRMGRTRGGIMREAMEFLRELAGDRLILGCGVPLGPSFGLVDYCRIGSDIGLKWEDGLLDTLHYRERVSTVNSLTSTIGRINLNGRAFLNDPDVFILRGINNKLTGEQRSTLFLLNQALGGLVFTSDNLNQYSKSEMEEYLSQFPFKDKKIKKVLYRELYEIHLEIDGLDYFVISNLEEKTSHYYMEEGIYFSREHGFMVGGREITLLPYNSLCLLRLKETDFEIAGSNCHLFPGSEISRFETSKDNITLEISENFKGRGEIMIKIPQGLGGFMINGSFLESEKIGDLNIIKVKVGI